MSAILAATPLADEFRYPLLNLFWTMLELFVWIIWIFLLFRIILDIFRSRDLGGWGKTGWLVLILVLPLIGVLIYLIARGGSMHERDVAQMRANDEAFRSYVKHVSSSTSTAEELEKLSGLRTNGVITQEEFDAQKAKILGS